MGYYLVLVAVAAFGLHIPTGWFVDSKPSAAAAVVAAVVVVDSVVGSGLDSGSTDFGSGSGSSGFGSGSTGFVEAVAGFAVAAPIDWSLGSIAVHFESMTEAAAGLVGLDVVVAAPAVADSTGLPDLAGFADCRHYFVGSTGSIDPTGFAGCRDWVEPDLAAAVVVAVGFPIDSGSTDFDWAVVAVADFDSIDFAAMAPTGWSVDSKFAHSASIGSGHSVLVAVAAHTD